jgi:hypothetical protein
MSDLDLFRKLTTLHLTQEEKRFMQQNVLLRSRERSVLSPITSLFMFSRSFVSVTAMALLLLVGTTVVHGAERSIPGDALYGMKRGVNERVLGVFAQSDDAKARLETKFVDRRLEEIQKIIVQEDIQDIADSASIGEVEQELSISPETLAIVVTLTEEVKQHAEMAQVHIENVSDGGSADDALVLASELESAIDVHTSTLATLTDDGGEEETLVAIAEAVQVLSDSSDSVAELGDTIAIAIVEDTSIVDREKAEAQLAEAEKLVALYILDNPAPVLDIVPDITVDTTEPVVADEVVEDVVVPAIAVAQLLQEIPVEPVADIVAIEPEIVAVAVENETSAVVEIDETTVLTPAYVLPTLEEIQAKIAACRAYIETGDYANAYIVCTDAVQSISTLTQVQEKTEVVVEAEAVPDAVPTDEPAVTLVDEAKAEETKVEVLDSTSLTGKVLDAFDQAR